MQQQRTILLLLFMVISAHISSAQQDSTYTTSKIVNPSASFPSNQLYFEFGGNAVYLSINYEHIFQNHFGYRLGLGVTATTIYEPGSLGSDNAGVAIAMGEYHYPLSNVFFVKAGLGAVSLLSFDLRNHWGIAPDSSNIQPIALTGSLGMEYIHSGGGFTASLSATPICSLFPMHILGWFGFTFGGAF